MTRPVRWGVVGAGWVARAYALPALAADPAAELVGVCDHDPGALAGLDAPGVTDLDALLDREPDAVYVATPNDAHAAVVGAVAERGVAVLCEKPLAHDVSTARAMVAAVRRAGVLGATAFDQRFHPAHERIAELVAGGELGTVTAVRIVYGCWLPDTWVPPDAPAPAAGNWRIDPVRAGGGALIDLAPHGLDLTGRLLGDDVDELAVLTATRVHPYAADDGGVLAGRTSRGVLLGAQVSFATPDALPRRRLEVVGTRAQLVALDTMGQTAGGTLTLLDAATGAPADVDFDRTAGPFARQLARFGAAARGEGPWDFPLERDLALHELLLASTTTPDPATAAHTATHTEVPPCR